MFSLSQNLDLQVLADISCPACFVQWGVVYWEGGGYCPYFHSSRQNGFSVRLLLITVLGQRSNCEALIGEIWPAVVWWRHWAEEEGRRFIGRWWLAQRPVRRPPRFLAAALTRAPARRGR